ncbi:AAA family ATPase [Staphylococcus simulans]
MKTTIKMSDMTLGNIKNVNYGSFNTNANFSNINKSNVVGFYGQNGSGKTAVVDAFKIIESLIENRELSQIGKRLVTYGKENLWLQAKFIVILENQKKLYLEYYVEISEKDSGYHVESEKLVYKEDEKGKRFKTLVQADSDTIYVRNQNIKTMRDEMKIQGLVSFHLSKKQRKSLIFNSEMLPIYNEVFSKEEMQIFYALSIHFVQGLHIIENRNYGLLMANILIPFNIFQDEVKGIVPLSQSVDNKSAAIPKKIFDLLKREVFPNINVVLPCIVPGLTIEINEIAEIHKEDGTKGIQFELLSNRNGNRLPLNTESEGIIKIISMLSVLSALFKETNVCVVVDELDAGVFEYLLGEVLKIVDESAKGQLIFTSHNLRIVELLPTHSIWFTTTNSENRYVQLKHTSKTSNNRDVYIRSLQIKNQQEELYDKTDNFKIKRAFKKLARKGSHHEKQNSYSFGGRGH